MRLNRSDHSMTVEGQMANLITVSFSTPQHAAHKDNAAAGTGTLSHNTFIGIFIG